MAEKRGRKEKAKWGEMYPGGYVSRFSMRHMPVEVHRRLHILAAVRGCSLEYVIIQALEVGLERLEAESYMPEVREEVGRDGNEGGVFVGGEG